MTALYSFSHRADDEIRGDIDCPLDFGVCHACYEEIWAKIRSDNKVVTHEYADGYVCNECGRTEQRIVFTDLHAREEEEVCERIAAAARRVREGSNAAG